MKIGHNYQYTVLASTEEVPGVRTITFRPTIDDIPLYRPGQFITVYYPGASTIEGKSYSLTSLPGESILSITVKAMGEFSNMLCSLRPTDQFSGSGPYGYFYSESLDTDLVMIGAGIGSVPYRSMIKEELTLHPDRQLHLIRSSTATDRILFREELDSLAQKHTNFHITDFITRQEGIPEKYRKGRIDVSTVLDCVSGFDSPEFLLCGPISFTRDLWKGLRQHGVPDDHLYTEAFFS